MFVCQSVIPEMNSAVKSIHSKVETVYVKGDDEMRRSYGINQTPAVSLFINGGNHTFKGAIKDAEVVKWVIEKAEWWAGLEDEDDEDDDNLFD